MDEKRNWMRMGSVVKETTKKRQPSNLERTEEQAPQTQKTTQKYITKNNVKVLQQKIDNKKE